MTVDSRSGRHRPSPGARQHRRLPLAASADSRRGLTVAARLVWIERHNPSDLTLKAQAIRPTWWTCRPLAATSSTTSGVLADNRTTFRCPPMDGQPNLPGDCPR